MKGIINKLLLLAPMLVGTALAADGVAADPSKVKSYIWVGVLIVATLALLFSDYERGLSGRDMISSKLKRFFFKGIFGWLISAIAIVLLFDINYVGIWPSMDSMEEMMMGTLIGVFILLVVYLAWTLIVLSFKVKTDEVVEEPVKEEDILLDHEYDGIKELDNDLPSWWVYLFYITTAFGIVYLYHYEIGDGNSSEQDYIESMERAKIAKEEYLAKAGNSVDETNVTLLTDAGSVAAGKDVFVTFCATCHGDKGQGGAGPNLTDAYWLHGGSVQDVFKTVKYGVPEKGMVAWQEIILPIEIQQVTSYIKTLKGTNPEGAKDPQGNLYEGE